MTDGTAAASQRNPTSFCDDATLGYLRSRTALPEGVPLTLDEPYRLAHLPLVAPGHPGVIARQDGRFYEMGRHPSVFSAVLPIDEAGNTVLVGQQRFPFGRYSWELPEGGGPENLPPLAGAQRELSEECWLRAEHWLPLVSDMHMSNSITDERAYAFLAWGLAPDDTFARDSSEELTVRRVSFADAVKMAASGEITDAFSLVMLLKADHLLRTGGLPSELSRLMQGKT